ncbi:MAG: leucine-rich repeat protein [Clostridia bacterium]|nr:leucine-rich repeat protein [Clostridia bacterium]
MKKKFSKIGLAFILTFIIIAISITVAIVAANYTDPDGVKWTFNVNSDKTTATITGVTLTKQTKEFIIPSTVTDENGNVYTVTAIGNNAFNQSSKKLVFGKLTIPNTVTSIGSGAFANTYIFGKVEIPESVTSIGSSAFSNCDGITEVVLSSNVKTIESDTFNGCYALNTINLDNVVTIKGKAFYECTALCYISLSNKLKTIESNAFYNCFSLHGKIDISSVTSIGQNAFYQCKGIESFVIPDVSHNMNAYNTCIGVEAYYTTENNQNYLSIDGVLHSKDGKTLLIYPSTKSDAEYRMSDTVTTIGSLAFNDTKNLKTVIIGKNVTKLENQAFANSSITHAYISESVTTVGFDLFKNCKELTWVVFGSNVQAIGTGAFYNTPALELVIAKSDKVTPVATNASFYYASEYACSEHIYGYSDKAPTCEEYGYNKCIICDRYDYIKETNHSGAILEEVKVSCTTDGYRVVECMTCNKTVTTITEKSTGHISNGKVYSISASYKSPAFKYSTCTVCGNMYVLEYDADFYVYGDVNCDGRINFADLAVLKKYINDNSSVEEISIVNADIARDGKVDQKDLSMLNAYLNGHIDALPELNITCSSHSKNTIELYKASCSQDGFRIRYCIDCGALTDEITTEKLEHNFTDSLVISPTCSKTGQRVSSCSTCEKTIVETLDKTEHTGRWYTIDKQRGYEYTSCDICGEIASRIVDYSKFDALIKQIPKYYNVYFQPETVNIIEPIIANHDLSLTQAEVDQSVRILSDALANAQYMVYDVPVVFINADIFTQDYNAATVIIAYMGDDGKTKIEAIDYNGQVKIRGRSSASHSKTPYNFKFNSKIDLFGMGAGKKYCLLSNQNDTTLIKNALMFELSDLLGIENSCKYEVVDLYTNGTYRGSYLLTTPVDVGSDRVDIDEDYDFLFEVEHSPLQEDKDKSYLLQSPIFGIEFLVNSPEIEDMKPEALSSVRTTVALIDFAIKSGDWELIQKYVDVDSVAKYFILHDMLKEVDIIWDSTRFYVKDGKLYGGPGWDFDLSMFNDGSSIGGGTAVNERAYYQNLSGSLCEGGVLNNTATGVWASVEWIAPSKDSTDDRIWFCSLYKHSPDFVKLVCKYVGELNDEMSLLYEDQLDSKGKVSRQNIIDSIVKDEKIEGSIIRNRNKFNISKSSYDQAISNLRNWLKDRNEWMQEFYANKLKTLP